MTPTCVDCGDNTSNVYFSAGMTVIRLNMRNWSDFLNRRVDISCFISTRR